MITIQSIKPHKSVPGNGGVTINFPGNVTIAALIDKTPLVTTNCTNMRPFLLVFRLIFLIKIHDLKNKGIKGAFGGLCWLLRET
jgi:hypothetical protein